MSKTMASRAMAAIAFSAVMLCGCESTTPLNSNPPAYIKEVVAYKEGHEGMVVYLVLADEKGVETTADGTLTITISETEGHGSTAHYRELMKTNLVIMRSQFTKTTVGQGPYEREAVILSLGRLVQEDFLLKPLTRSGDVSVYFRPTIDVKDTERVLEGRTTVAFGAMMLSPLYIKDVVAYKDGHEGMVVYLMLVDEKGRETSADGVLRIVVEETEGSGRTAHHRVLMWKEVTIMRNQFVRTTVGQDPYEREAVILSLGKEDFRLKPVTKSGDVSVLFRQTSDGMDTQRVLEGKTTVTF